MAWACPEKVRWLRFSPSSLLLATTSEALASGPPHYETFAHRLWDVATGRELAHRESTTVLHAVAFASERELLIVGEDGCHLWDVDSGETREVSDLTNALVVLPNGKAVSSTGHGLRIFDPRSGELGHELTVPAGAAVYNDEMAAAGRYLAACCRRQDEYRNQQVQAALWDVERGKLMRTYDVDVGRHRWDDWPDVTVALHPGGSLIAVGTTKVQSFGLDWEEPLEGFTPFECQRVFGLRYSADGRSLQVLSNGRLVRLGARTGRVLSAVEVPSSLAWDRGVIDPNGEKVAVAAGRRIEVLDVLDA